MSSRLPNSSKIVIKPYFWLDRVSKQNERFYFLWLTITTAVMNNLSLVITAVSRIPSLEESLTGSYACLESL